jgi:hypothetical protein
LTSARKPTDVDHAPGRHHPGGRHAQPLGPGHIAHLGQQRQVGQRDQRRALHGRWLTVQADAPGHLLQDHRACVDGRRFHREDDEAQPIVDDGMRLRRRLQHQRQVAQAAQACGGVPARAVDEQVLVGTLAFRYEERAPQAGVAGAAAPVALGNGRHVARGGGHEHAPAQQRRDRRGAALALESLWLGPRRRARPRHGEQRTRVQHRAQLAVHLGFGLRQHTFEKLALAPHHAQGIEALDQGDRRAPEWRARPRAGAVDIGGGVEQPAQLAICGIAPVVAR